MSDGSNVFSITDSPKQAQIELVITRIRSRLAAASLVEKEKIAHLDVQAQKLRCDAAMAYFANHAAIVAECVRRNVSLKTLVGVGERSMQRIRQLHKLFDEYKSKRLKYDGDDFGFRLACRLAGIPIDPPADSDDETGRHGETDGSGDEPNDGDADERHETPDWLFDMLDRLLRFTCDAAASAKNTKVKEKFFTKEMNGLLQLWVKYRVWLNPPYAQGEIRKWLSKTLASGAELVMALLPARMNSKWWRELVQPFATIVLIPPGGRLTFGDFEQSSRDDVVLVLFARNAPWALNALAPHLAEPISHIGYEGDRRIGTLQTATLLLEPRELAPTPLRYWRVPPDLLERLKREYDIDDFDPFPYPCAEGHDAFAMERWPCEPGKWILINGSFVAADELHGRGLTAVVRKVIEQHARYGTKFLVFMPTTDAVNRLMDAGAAMRSLGRVRWLEVDTLEPWPNPGASMLFILDSTDSAK